MADYIEREAARLAVMRAGYIENILPTLEAVPAADVAPVVHGRWIDAYGEDTVGMVNGVPWSDCTCSVCGEHLTGSGEYPAKGNYCPNCGAKMEA